MAAGQLLNLCAFLVFYEYEEILCFKFLLMFLCVDLYYVSYNSD